MIIRPPKAGYSQAPTNIDWPDHHTLRPLWVGDAKFVLDRVEKLDQAGAFRGRLDLNRIGMLGFSFGGAAALEMAVRDPASKPRSIRTVSSSARRGAPARHARSC